MEEKLTRKIVLTDLKKEIDRIKKLSKLEEPTESEEYREPLSLDVTQEVKVLLSWGGGEDGFKLKFRDKELISGVYYMANWGEYEEIELNEEELEEVFDFYLYGDTSLLEGCSK